MSNASFKLAEARKKILDELKPLDEYSKFYDSFKERAEKGEFSNIDEVLERWRGKLILCHGMPGRYSLEILPPTGNPSVPMAVLFSHNRKWSYLEYATLPHRASCPMYGSDNLESLLPNDSDQKILKEFKVNFGIHFKTSPVPDVLHKQLREDWGSLDSAVSGKKEFIDVVTEEYDLAGINKELELKTLDAQLTLKRSIASMRVTLGCLQRYLSKKS